MNLGGLARSCWINADKNRRSKVVSHGLPARAKRYSALGEAIEQPRCFVGRIASENNEVFVCRLFRFHIELTFI